MTNEQYASLRNLLWVVVALLVASVGSNIYAGLKLDANTRVFEKIYTLLETGLGERFTVALAQASAIEKELGQARQHARVAAESLQGVDAQFRKAAADAENSLVARLDRELPALMDRYVESRLAKLRDPATREEVRKLLREELTRIVREEPRTVPKQ